MPEGPRGRVQETATSAQDAPIFFAVWSAPGCPVPPRAAAPVPQPPHTVPLARGERTPAPGRAPAWGARGEKKNMTPHGMQKTVVCVPPLSLSL